MATDPFSPTPRGMWLTNDEHDEVNPYKPLPEREYIRQMLRLLDSEQIIIIEKSRQMLMSTLTAAFIAWHVLLGPPGRLWLVSKSKALDAYVLIRDKIRLPYSRCPAWFKEARPLSMAPQHEIVCSQTNSRILALNSAASVGSARGVTSSGVLVDEAAFCPETRDLYAASIPQSARMILVTTPSMLPGGQFVQQKLSEAEGGPLMKKYMTPVTEELKAYEKENPQDDFVPTSKKSKIDVVAQEKIKTLPAFVVRKSSDDENSFCTVTLSYRADPHKNSLKWLTKASSRMPDMRSVRREFLLDWSSSEGASFYEMADRPEVFVDKTLRYDPNKIVYRGFDFGYRFPAVVWAQKTDTNRVHILRSLIPSSIDTYSFRDLVLYLSGQTLLPNTNYDPDRELQALTKRPRAMEILRQLKKQKPYWTASGPRGDYPVPFFPSTARFESFSGPEALRVTATVDSTTKERTDADVFASGNILLVTNSYGVESGETLIRKCLLDQPHDNKPGILFHPFALDAINAIGGGVVYAKPTATNPRPQTAAKEGFYEHIHDAIRYMISNILSPEMFLDEYVHPVYFRESAELEKHKNLRDGVREEQNMGGYETELDWDNLDSFIK